MSGIRDLGIEGIYVIHARTGYESHEKRINHLFARHGLDFEFVTDGDPSLFSKELLDKYFSPDIDLSQGIRSCTLNHILTYERIVKNSNKYALVFENDPFFLGDFTRKITRICLEVKKAGLRGFIISLENTCLRFPSFGQAKKGQHIYPAVSGRAAGAYLIDLEAAKAILEDLRTTKCHTVIDWWHNSLIDRGIVKVYWAHPPLTEQGSHNGKLCSSISSQEKSLARRVKWNSQKLYKSYIRRLFKEKNITE